VGGVQNGQNDVQSQVDRVRTNPFKSFPDVPMTREAGASRRGSQAGAWEPADGWFFTVINKNDEENKRKVISQ